MANMITNGNASGEPQLPYLTAGESSPACLDAGLVCSIDPTTGRCTECGSIESTASYSVPVEAILTIGDVLPGNRVVFRDHEGTEREGFVTAAYPTTREITISQGDEGNDFPVSHELGSPAVVGLVEW